MRNIKLVLEYDGGRYDGWQRLGKRESTNTIERKLLDVIERMTKEPVTLFVGCRTEAGVHAQQQVANFKTQTELSVLEIRRYLNRYLPMDINVVYVDDVPENYQTPLDVKSVTYQYHMVAGDAPSVFKRRYVYHCFKNPDLEKMQEAAKLLVGKHDFAMLTTAKRLKSTERIMHSIHVVEMDGEIQIEMEATEFLHNMARMIVSLLIDVGQGVRDCKDVQALLQGHKLEEELMPCDSRGLFLHKVSLKS